MSTVVGNTCPYCQSPVQPDEKLVLCSRCGLVHHAQCWAENGRCTTFGCGGVPVEQAAIPASEGQDQTVDLTLDSVSCQNCGTANPLNAIYCRRCGVKLAQMVKDKSPQPIQQPAVSRPVTPAARQDISTNMVTSVICTLFCCLPVGLVAIFYSTRAQRRLEEGDYEAAKAAAETASNWNKAAFAAGIIFILIKLATLGKK